MHTWVCTHQTALDKAALLQSIDTGFQFFLDFLLNQLPTQTFLLAQLLQPFIFLCHAFLKFTQKFRSRHALETRNDFLSGSIKPRSLELFLQRIVRFAEGCQLFVEPQDMQHRNRGIHSQICKQQCCRKFAPCTGNRRHKICNHRLHHAHHEGCQNAPLHGTLQADAPLDIKGLLGIIPPCGMEKLFQYQPDEIFHNGCNHKAAQKQQQNRIRNRLQCQKNQQCACAVNGAERAIDKAAIHPFFRVDRNIR